MRQYERNAVTVDMCVECRGVFLDRGELERLIDAESAWAAQRAQPAQPTTYQQPADRARYRDHDSDEYPVHGHGAQGHAHRKKRGGFLSELFD